jgi:hypothetical protein
VQHPRAVFAALRDDSPEAADARAEPMLAIVWLAGIAGVLSSNVAGHVLDDFEIDGVLLAVWAFLAGGIHGAAAYFLLGAGLLLGLELAGGRARFRQARHLLGLAAVPIALSLAVWPVRLALYGSDVFRSGGDDAGAGGSVFEGIEVAFFAWSGLLLLIGIRSVYGWSWARALGASAVPLLLLVLALATGYGAF